MASSSEVVNLDVSTYRHDDDIFSNSEFFDSKEDHANYLSPGVVDFLKKEGYLPNSAEVFVPEHPTITPSWECSGWFCIYEIAFRAGFKIPCRQIHRDTIEALGLSPCQLMPSVWKLLYGISFLCEKHSLTLTVQEIMNNYHERGYGKGKVIFRIRNGCPHLISGLDYGDDKQWCEKFMFIKKSSLGEDDAFIPATLSEKGIGGKAKSFLAIPETERSWSELSKVMFPSHGRVDPNPLKIELPADGVAPGAVPGPRTRGRLNVANVKQRVETLKKPGGTMAALLKFKPLKITSGTRVTSRVPKVNKEKVSSTPKGKSVQFDAPITGESKKGKLADVFGLEFSEADIANLPLNKGQRYIDMFKEVATPKFLEIGVESLAQRSAHAVFQTLESISALGCLIQQDRAEVAGLQDKVAGLEATCSGLKKELSQERKATLAVRNKAKEAEALAEKLKEERKDWDLAGEEELFKQLFPREDIPNALDVTPSREVSDGAEEDPQGETSGLADKENDDE
ncbi:hypothetical protein RND81_09G104200 [Saponaria officinalis]|uniref:Uncharacterized protein n=1 Tax=Saponaria officinalis TaxID=3572 RepID=A0AAW1IL17_SAPOF